MILRAPRWSDLSPQLMHGYPRARCPLSHGGFLKGNLTVAAKISNQAMRSVAAGDIACLCSRSPLSALGLTVSELFLARRAAIKYYSQERQPSRLVDAMMRFGMDFSTLTPLSHDQLSALLTASSQLQQIHLQDLQQAADSEPSSTESEGETADTAPPEVRVRVSRMRPQSSSSTPPEPEVGQLEDCTVQLMLRFVSRGIPAAVIASQHQGQETAASPEPEGDVGETGDNGVDSERERRASGTAPAVTQSSGRRKRRRRRPTGPAVPSEIDMRAKLATFPGINMARVPTADTLTRMGDYMRKYQPISREAITTRQQRGGEWLDDDEASMRLHRLQRKPRVEQLLKSLW